MVKKKGPWVVEESGEKYRNPWIEVREEKVIRPDGQAGLFATVRMRSGVSVLAVDDEGYAYLTREFRYAIERESVEVASGAIDEGESPRVAAARELREELGIVASEWIDLGFVDPFTSVVNSPASLFLARALQFVETAHEGTEIIHLLRLRFSDAVRMVMQSEISHGPSCVLILKAHHYLSGQQTNEKETDA